MSKKKVYVSSTFADLKKHRLAVKTALEGAQYDVECMEKYSAFEERPKDKCLADVGECDYYVLILAHRYGFVPPKDNAAKKSMTHLEYDWAVTCRKPILAFLVDEDHSWPPKLMDRDSLDPRSQIGALRAQVELDHGRQLFSTPDNLATQVLEALCRKEEQERRSVGGSERTAPLPGFRWPAPWDFTAYVESKREGFVGRDRLFAEVRDWLAGGPERGLLIRADFGVGKSAIMAELLRRNSGGAVAGWYFCQHDTRETLNPATFVRSLAAQFRETIPGYGDAIEADAGLQERLDAAHASPAGTFEAAILNVLIKLPPPPTPRLVLIDALDEGLELDSEAARKSGTIVSLLATKAERMPAWLRVLATSRNIRGVIVPLQQAFGLREIDAEDARNLDDLTAYVRARCSREPLASKLNAAAESAESIADLLRAKSGGKFLYAARALNDLANGALAARDIEHLPPGMDGFYLDAFERRFGADGARYEPVRDALGVLATAREPLPPAVLAAILGRDEAAVKQALAVIPDFIRVRQGRYGFDHFSLAEWLTLESDQFVQRAESYAVNLRVSAERIRAWAQVEVRAKRAHTQPYLVRHLAAHLEDAERSGIYTELMRDPHWLAAKPVHAGVDSLLADCALLPETESARLLSTALCNSLPAIKRDARQIAGQLLGRLSAHQRLPDILALCDSIRGSRDFSPTLVPQTASLRLDAALLTTLHGHEDWVMALAVLPGGRIVSGSTDRTVRVWDAGGGGEPLVLRGHDRGVSALAVLPDGRIASGSDDHTVRVWDAGGRGGPVVLRGHESRVNTLTVLPDGRIASGSDDRTVRVWDAGGRGEPVVLRGHDSRVSALATLADGRIASGSHDGTVRLWDAWGRGEPVVLRGHDGGVGALAVLPDGRIASGSNDRTVRMWDVAGRSNPAVLRGHEGGVNALTVLPGGRIASSSDDRTVRVWDAGGRGELAVLRGHEDWVMALAVLPDGRVASGSADRTVRVWDPGGRGEPRVLRSHERRVTALAVLLDRRVASGSDDRTVRVWDAAGHGEPVVLRGHDGGVSALAALPDGRIASGSDDRTVRLWDPGGRGESVVLRGHDGGISALAALPDGRIASGSNDRTVRVWDAAGHGKPVVLRGHEGEVSALTVLPDGCIASGSNNGTVRVWKDGGRGKPVVLRGHARDVNALTVLPDGRIASGSDDGTVRVWDARVRGEPVVLRGHEGWIMALAVLPDGRIASGSHDGTVRVWDAGGRGEPVVLRGHEGEVNALTVLPDGRIASGSNDRTVRVWDLRTASIVAMFVADGMIWVLATPPSGMIVAGDGTGAVHFLALIE